MSYYGLPSCGGPRTEVTILTFLQVQIRQPHAVEKHDLPLSPA